MIYLVYTIMLMIFGCISLIFAPNYNFILFLFFILGAYAFLKSYIKFNENNKIQNFNELKVNKNIDYQIPSKSLISHKQVSNEKLENELIEKLNNYFKNNKLNFEIKKVGVYSSIIQIIISSSSYKNLNKLMENETDFANSLELGKIEINTIYSEKNTIEIICNNNKPYPLYLYDCIKGKQNKNKLNLYVGKDDNNNNSIIHLDKHKSLFLTGIDDTDLSKQMNSILINLIMQNTPDDLNLILIDGKKIEFIDYANLPHLLCPIVTDIKKGVEILENVINEIKNREDYIIKNNLKNISETNKFKKLVVIINDLDLLFTNEEKYNELLKLIIRKGTKVEVYLIVSTNYVNYNNKYNNILSMSDVTIAFKHNKKSALNKYKNNIILNSAFVYNSRDNTVNRITPALVSNDDIKNVIDFYTK